VVRGQFGVRRRTDLRLDPDICGEKLGQPLRTSFA
jgi:hypothetical protein